MNRHLNASAIIGPDGTLSFRELNELSDRIGAKLLSREEESFVLFMNPSRFYFASLIACMKTGKIAVPAEPSESDDVIRRNTDQLSGYVCLTTSELVERSETLFESKSILRADSHHNGYQKLAEPFVRNPLTYPSHKVFTSGTTGTQKLITISRESLFVHSVEASEMYQYRPGIVMANLGRHSSSIIINGFWRCILCASSFLFTDLKKEAFSDISKRLTRYDTKILQGPSTLLEKFLLSESSKNNFREIEHLIFGGEPLNPHVLEVVADNFDKECLVTLNYSSSETMLISAYTSTYHRMQQLAKVPVGTPAPSKKVNLFNEEGDQVSDNEPGEVVVSSKHIAISVVKDGREQIRMESADRDLRTYFTGDLAKWNKDGLLEHLGRKDARIKINGVWIDTHRIESKLKEIDGIKNAFIVQEETEGEGKQLFAFLAGRRDDLSDLNIIKHLSKTLRPAFLPNHFADIDQVPVNSRGKVDRAKLKSICSEIVKKSRNHTSEQDKKYSEMEIFLMSEWEKVLNKKVEDSSVSFFAAGGDSLAMSELTLNVRKKTGRNVQASWVFEHPSIRDQARYLESGVIEEDSGRDSTAMNEKDEAEIKEIKNLLGW
jgi:acyl-coenzyme A synthetase/AMP-(fatty) acid ligase